MKVLKIFVIILINFLLYCGFRSILGDLSSLDDSIYDGYNSPLLYGSTSDTEFMVNTSLYPSNSGYITFHRYASNLYPTTLAKQFKANGYETDAYHNSAGDFYNRNAMLKQLGYNFLDSNLLGLGAGSLDSNTLSVAKWIIYEKVC